MTAEKLKQLQNFQKRIDTLKIHKTYLEHYYKNNPFELQVSVKLINNKADSYLSGYYPPDKMPASREDELFILEQIQSRIEFLEKEFSKM
jgi:hypothetical protein